MPRGVCICVSEAGGTRWHYLKGFHSMLWASGRQSLCCSVVVAGGRQSKSLKGKGTGFLAFANTAGLFMEAELPPEARSCCQLSSWNTSLAVTWSCLPLFRGWQMIWINVWHLYTCDLRSYAGRMLLVSSLKRSWFTRPRNWMMLSRGTTVS